MGNADLPADLAHAVDGRDLLVFDGHCNLCAGWVRFLLARDGLPNMRFVTAQSDLGDALYAALSLKSDDYDTFIVVLDGKVLTEMDAAIAVLGRLGWPWKAACLAARLPRPVKSAIYRAVARSRYAIFGRRDTCFSPPPGLQDRFESRLG
ncbi:MAG: DCC1-like thiol-disulfide oxidoreductase family protein [Pseudomonadota bacterium]